MADEVVEVVDDGVVTIDITGNPDLAPPDDPVEPVVAAPAPKPPRERQQKTNAAEEAAAALSQAVKTAETEATARKAAEATAAAERSQREAAQRLAEQRAQEARGYKDEADSNKLALITSDLEAAKRDMAAAEADIERFQEAGEFGKSAKAQGQLARAASAIDRLETAKADFESGARRTPTTEGRVEAPAQLSPVDQYLSMMGPRAQSWLRAHPECLPADLPGGGGNAVSNAKMMQGHYAAKAKGLAEGTEAYFEVIEEHTGHREPTVEADTAPVSSAAAVVQAEPARPAPKPVRTAPTAAPVSRDAPGPNGAPTSRTVTLTPQEQEIARLSFQQKPGEDEDVYRKRANQMYAVEKIKMIAEGKYGRTTH